MTATETVHTYFGSLASGDREKAISLFHDNIEWWVVPASPFAGLHAGKEAVLAMLAKTEELYDPAVPLRIELINIIAEDDRCAAEARLTRTSTTGAEYKNYYHFLFHCRDDKIVGVKEYFDTLHAQRVLFSTIN